MNELLPIGSGILIGLLAGSLRGRWSTVAYMSIVAVAIGLGSAWVNGELELSWGFALFDVGQVLVSAAFATRMATMVTASVRGRRATSST